MLLRRTPTPTFKNFEAGILTGFVILIMSVDTKESGTDLWSKVKLEAEKLVPADMEILELPVDRILEVLNFKKILQQEKLLESQGQAMHSQGQAIQELKELLQQQGQAIQRQEQAIQRQEQAIQRQEQLLLELTDLLKKSRK
jgi:hypothetical protein